MNLSEITTNSSPEAASTVLIEMYPNSRLQRRGQEAAAGHGGPHENDSRPAVKTGIFSQTGKKGYHFTKRLLDILLVSFALLLCFPIFLLLAILVKATSRGPVLFKQQRVGLHGKTFWCYKFRTMIADAEELLKKNAEMRAQYENGGYKMKNDPRITRIGGFLRKTSLDELPQFFNVLVGEMSLIGPRPVVPPELSQYGEFADKLVTVKPGLGGMWQACGRSDIPYRERVELDMIYIDHCSLGMDFKLMLKTAAAICRLRGAY